MLRYNTETRNDGIIITSSKISCPLSEGEPGDEATLNYFSSPQRFYDVVFPSIGVPLSDHYGVKVRLSNIRLNCNAIQECRYHCVSEIKPLPPLQVDFSEVCFD